MARYSYRLLMVSIWDSFHVDFSKTDKMKRRGDEPKRILIVSDVLDGSVVHFPDEDGDDYAAFSARSRVAFLKHLNNLGSQGWQVILPYRENESDTFPEGEFLLMQTLD